MMRLLGFMVGRVSIHPVSPINLSIGLLHSLNNNDDDDDGHKVNHMFDIQFNERESIELDLQNGEVSTISISPKISNLKSFEIATLCNEFFSIENQFENQNNSIVDVLFKTGIFKTDLKFQDYKLLQVLFNSVQFQFNDLGVVIQVPKTKLVQLLMRDVEIGEFTIDTITNLEDGDGDGSETVKL
ncbi:unnamed protein product [Ambrosiozyma monospora]|uniref:Unnamed protein product n=1 Tax=Ambrosiozyma monospora TaxID=43982 RepID=A0A9W6T930_AMBMO|nr:unnamed protein product [Ambrosiozyma monospora]